MLPPTILIPYSSEHGTIKIYNKSENPTQQALTKYKYYHEDIY